MEQNLWIVEFGKEKGPWTFEMTDGVRLDISYQNDIENGLSRISPDDTLFEGTIRWQEEWDWFIRFEMVLNLKVHS